MSQNVVSIWADRGEVNEMTSRDSRAKPKRYATKAPVDVVDDGLKGSRRDKQMKAVEKSTSTVGEEEMESREKARMLIENAL